MQSYDNGRRTAATDKKKQRLISFNHLKIEVTKENWVSHPTEEECAKQRNKAPPKWWLGLITQ